MKRLPILKEYFDAADDAELQDIDPTAEPFVINDDTLPFLDDEELTDEEQEAYNELEKLPLFVDPEDLVDDDETFSEFEEATHKQMDLPILDEAKRKKKKLPIRDEYKKKTGCCCA